MTHILEKIFGNKNTENAITFDNLAKESESILSIFTNTCKKLKLVNSKLNVLITANEEAIERLHKENKEARSQHLQNNNIIERINQIVGGDEQIQD